jgi:hypothetical protein
MGRWGGAALKAVQAQRRDHCPESAPQPTPRGHGNRSSPDAVPEPKSGHGASEDKATDEVHHKEVVYESLQCSARVPPRVGPQHRHCQEAHPVGHHQKEGKVQELDPPSGVRAGGGRGAKKEDVPTEEGLGTHHHCSGMGAVDVPGGDADGKEVGRARSGGREGAVVTRSKITLSDGEASAVNPARRSRWARRGEMMTTTMTFVAGAEGLKVEHSYFGKCLNVMIFSWGGT